MSSQSLRLVQRKVVPADSRVLRLARQLSRFGKSVQPGAKALAARHPALADLAVSFPALFAALARPRRHFDPEPVIAATIAGMPLSYLAERAYLPLWLRKLPPEAFDNMLQELPAGPDFARRIVNHLPKTVLAAKNWLEAVSLGYHWAHPDFALWLARHFAGDKGKAKRIDHWQIRRLSLWAFYSSRPQTRAHALIDTAWNARIGLKAATAAANHWSDAVDLFLHLGDEPLADMWLTPGRVGGLEFVPLKSAVDVLSEARAMGNCLRTYGHALAHNRVRLWSMRKDGKRIATLRLDRGRREVLPNLHELEFARNTAATPDVWWAAHQWLRMHDLTKVRCNSLPWNTAPLSREVWVDLWRPWWLEKKRLPQALPLAPSRDLFGWA